VHCKKGDKECKFWFLSKEFDLEESFSYNMNMKDKREIKKIIFNNFDYIESQWKEFQKRKSL
ncbi:MAG: DUF4160 domain-containing protein, partial [Bacteroidia bacterium]|nr:DUF4160 domain-containing protein [Bacteroidia bacterium]